MGTRCQLDIGTSLWMWRKEAVYEHLIEWWILCLKSGLIISIQLARKRFQWCFGQSRFEPQSDLNGRASYKETTYSTQRHKRINRFYHRTSMVLIGFDSIGIHLTCPHNAHSNWIPNWTNKWRANWNEKIHIRIQFALHSLGAYSMLFNAIQCFESNFQIQIFPKHFCSSICIFVVY